MHTLLVKFHRVMKNMNQIEMQQIVPLGSVDHEKKKTFLVAKWQVG
jgi:hypothetical protein